MVWMHGENNEYNMARRVLMEEVKEWQFQGRLRFG